MDPDATDYLKGYKDLYKNGGNKKETYNLKRAKEINVPEIAPDDRSILEADRPHWGSVDPETGNWLKSMDHPTAWMENLQYSLNPELNKKFTLGVNPEGYFKEKQLKYTKRKK